MTVLESLLIANRGEIARRIIKTARRMGVRSIVVYSDADAGLPFARLERSLRGEIVEPDAGMRVDDAERRRLQLQVLDDERQHHVLEHVREIAGVIGVAIVQARFIRRGRASNSPPQLGQRPPIASLHGAQNVHS